MRVFVVLASFGCGLLPLSGYPHACALRDSAGGPAMLARAVPDHRRADRPHRGASPVAVGAASTATAPQDDSAQVKALLSAAGTYLAGYEQDIPAIVAEEIYRQEVRFENRVRVMRSDLLVLRDPDVGWISFRDVFEVDKRPVRTRNQRLVNLFLKPRRDAREQALRIVREGTRYNLSPRRIQLRRTINMPLTPLYFLRRGNQHRSTFAIDTMFPPPSDGTVVVAFQEHMQPRIVETPDRAAARGAFWIHPATGRVTAAVLIVDSLQTRATLHVTFSEYSPLSLWLPASMNEEYEIGTLGTVVGRAEYANFRRFQVDTTIDIPR